MKRFVIIQYKSRFAMYDKTVGNNENEFNNSFLRDAIVFDTDNQEEAANKTNKLNKLRSILK